MSETPTAADSPQIVPPEPNAACEAIVPRQNTGTVARKAQPEIGKLDVIDGPAQAGDSINALVLGKQSSAHPPLQPKAKLDPHASPSRNMSPAKEIVQHAGATTVNQTETASNKILAPPIPAESSMKELMDGSMIVKMGLAMMGSFSEGVMSLAKGEQSTGFIALSLKIQKELTTHCHAVCRYA